jgi:hypothetical protein
VKKALLSGIGPVCEKKLEKLKNEPPDGQLSFVEETVLVIK